MTEQQLAIEQSDQTPMLSEARRLVHAGRSVLPIRTDGSKAPDGKHLPLDEDGKAVWKPYQQQRPTDEELRLWFGNGRRLGLALIGGQVSGNAEGIDVDEMALWATFTATAEEHAPGLLERCVITQTPRPGRQIWYRCASPVDGNLKLAKGERPDEHGELKIRTLIETRGEGGYAVIPPSSGYVHETGRPYRLLQGDLAELPVITGEERAILLMAARMLNEYVEPERQVRSPSTQSEKTTAGLLPGDDLNARGDFGALLEKHGWTFAYEQGATQHWRRPGKTKGTSATLGHVAPGVLYVFTSNGHPFDAEHGYDLFAGYTLLEHDGDYSAAAKALYAEGYGDRVRAEQAPTPSDELAPPEPGSTPFDAGETLDPYADEIPEPSNTPLPELTDADDPDPGAKAQRAPSLDQLKYARLFAKEADGQWMYIDGDQWWEYQSNHWHYAGDTLAKSVVQHFLMKQKPVRSRQITSATVRGTLALAGPLLGPHRVDALNPHKDWIPLSNGVYDTATGQFFEHSPGHLFTYCLPFRYDPAADCPQIKAFLKQVLIDQAGRPCEQWIGFMEEWFGVCSVPDNRAQATLVNVGEGGNGKGTLARLLQRFVGAGQHHSPDIEMLHDPYHRAALVGKLVAFINEPSRRALDKNGGVLKAISGGDEISARNPCEKVFTFLPATRIVVSCNDLPATRDLSRGYFRRLILVEWRFTPSEPDTELDEKLAGELPGLFNLAMAGLKRFRDRKNRFAELPESDSLKVDYQKSQDTVAQFLEDVCTQGQGLVVVPSEFYRAYVAWCKAKGFRSPIEDNAFGQRLTKLKIAPSRVEKLEDGSTRRVRPGIALDLTALRSVLGPEAWRRFSGEKDQRGLNYGDEEF